MNSTTSRGMQTKNQYNPDLKQNKSRVDFLAMCAVFRFVQYLSSFRVLKTQKDEKINSKRR